MDTEISAALIGASSGFLACMVGWQMNLIALHRGIDRGHIAAFSVGMGAVAADLVFLAVGFTGLHPFARHPELWANLKWIAVVLLLAAAWKSYFRRKSGAAKRTHQKNPAKNFLLGFLVVVSNPVYFLVWIGVLSFLVSHFPGAKILQNRVVFIVGFIVGGGGWFAFLSTWILGHARKWDENRLHNVSRVMGVLIAVAALMLLVAKV